MQRLSFTKQLAFALLMTERMLPSLIDFSRETGFDCSCNLEGLKAVWSALQKGTVDSSLARECASNAPDTEIYSHKLTSYALNAALAIAEMMEFTADSCEDHITQIQALIRDSIYLYLGRSEGSESPGADVEVEIDKDPLWVKEVDRQEEDAEFLLNLSELFDNRTVSLIRSRASGQESLLPH